MAGEVVDDCAEADIGVGQAPETQGDDVLGVAPVRRTDNSTTWNGDWPVQGAAPNERTGGVTPSLSSACSQYSFYPYISNDYEYALADTEIQCSYSYAELDLSAVLNRDRWYGEQTIDGPVNAKVFNNNYLLNPLYWKCRGTGTYTYRDPASGRAEDWSGTWYYGNTTNSARFAC